MKKIIFLVLPLLLFSLLGCASNNSSNGNSIFNSKKIKTTDIKYFEDVVIESNYVTSYITPNGFDYDKLMEDYSMMTIKVSYYVTYEKTWSGLDFLYAGSPKYDITIKNQDNIGVEKTGLTTTSSKIKNSIVYTSDLVNLVNNRIILELGSTNIQNKILFSNIVVNYSCY